MKICVPTQTDKGKEAQVFEHFGSSPFFTIYDTESGDVDIVNNANQEHSHGMCQPMSQLKGKDIDAVVCGGMGMRAIQKLNEGGIKAYRAIPGTVENIAEQYVKGGLEEITIKDACTNHECH